MKSQWVSVKNPTAVTAEWKSSTGTLDCPTNRTRLASKVPLFLALSMKLHRENGGCKRGFLPRRVVHDRPPASRHRAGMSAAIRPFRMTSTRSLMASTSGRSEEIIRIAIPSRARSQSSAWISDFAPMSTPRVGSSTISSFGWVASHLAMTTRCWLPPLRNVAFCSTLGVLIASFFDVGLRQPVLLAAAQHAQPRKRLQHRHRDVLADRQAGHQALLLAVLGHQPDAGEDRAPRRVAGRNSLAVDADLAAVDCEVAEDRARQLGPAGADEPGHADDLAAPHREGDVAQQTALDRDSCTSSTVSPIGAGSLRKRSLMSRPIIMPIRSRMLVSATGFVAT